MLTYNCRQGGLIGQIDGGAKAEGKECCGIIMAASAKSDQVVNFFKLVISREGIVPTMIVICFARRGEIMTDGWRFKAGDDVIGGISYCRRATLVADYAAEHPRQHVESGVHSCIFLLIVPCAMKCANLAKCRIIFGAKPVSAVVIGISLLSGDHTLDKYSVRHM